MDFKIKSYIAAFLAFLIFIIFSIKLFSIQIMSNYIYTLKSSKNLETSEIIYPQRGEILDRNNVKIVTNIPVFNIYFLKPAKTIDQLHGEIFLISRLLNINFNDFLKKIGKSKINDKILLKANLEINDLSYILSNYDLFPDIRWESSYMRSYPLGESFFHSIGYIGEIDEKELKQFYDKNYQPGDLIGKIGLERYYDEILKGQKGKKIIKTNAKGEIIEEFNDVLPIPGSSLILSFDARIQEAATKLLEEYRGSVVVQDIKTGEIIAMASSPSIDPNIFIKGISKQELQKLFNNPNNPFLFRPIAAEYPASSIFKLLIALGNLVEKTIDPLEKILCKGSIQLGDREFKDVGVHGWETMADAIRDSCNVYFYNAGYKLGIEKIKEYSNKVGFGEITDIDILGEKSGFVPDPEWKEQKIGEPWFDGDTYNISIGQGYLLVTVLQINMYTAMIANKGYNYQPHFLTKIIDSKAKSIISKFENKIFKSVNIDHSLWDFLHNAMHNVVKVGTAWWGGTTAEVDIAGKTGTAQNLGEDHSWFTCFGPFDNPRYAITVMLENAGFGSVHAAPIAAILFDMLYSQKSIEQVKHDIDIARYKKYLQRQGKE